MQVPSEPLAADLEPISPRTLVVRRFWDPLVHSLVDITRTTIESLLLLGIVGGFQYINRWFIKPVLSPEDTLYRYFEIIFHWFFFALVLLALTKLTTELVALLLFPRQYQRRPNRDEEQERLYRWLSQQQQAHRIIVSLPPGTDAELFEKFMSNQNPDSVVEILETSPRSER
jgi:hypothetical protein